MRSFTGAGTRPHKRGGLLNSSAKTGSSSLEFAIDHLTVNVMYVYSDNLMNATHNTMAMCMSTMLMCMRVTVGGGQEAIT